MRVILLLVSRQVVLLIEKSLTSAHLNGNEKQALKFSLINRWHCGRDVGSTSFIDCLVVRAHKKLHRISESIGSMHFNIYKTHFLNINEFCKIQ